MSQLRDLLDVFKHVRDPRELGRLLLPDRLRGLRTLNEGPGPEGPSDAASADVAQTLRQLKNRLKAEALTADGAVDYTAVANSELYAELEETALLLRGLDLSALESDDARIAFWINVYNVLVIHGIIALGVRRSVMEVPAFFRWIAYRVGPHTLTPDQIEHGVLRRNAPDPLRGVPTFLDGDPRVALSPSRLDPRIHAALVCAAQSCPPVAFYEAERLDWQLEMAASGFVDGTTRVDHAERRVRLSLIFSMYRRDFSPVGPLGFAAERAGPELRTDLERARAEGYAIDYDRYDWSLNSVA